MNRRIREPWWHWPLAILQVVAIGSAFLCGLFLFAHFLGPRLNAWKEAHPGAYLAILLGVLVFVALAVLLAVAKDIVDGWRRKR